MRIKTAEVRKGLEVSAQESREAVQGQQAGAANEEERAGSAVLCAGRRAGERSGYLVPGW